MFYESSRNISDKLGSWLIDTLTDHRSSICAFCFNDLGRTLYSAMNHTTVGSNNLVVYARDFYSNYLILNHKSFWFVSAESVFNWYNSNGFLRFVGNIKFTRSIKTKRMAKILQCIRTHTRMNIGRISKPLFIFRTIQKHENETDRPISFMVKSNE